MFEVRHAQKLELRQVERINGRVIHDDASSGQMIRAFFGTAGEATRWTSWTGRTAAALASSSVLAALGAWRCGLPPDECCDPPLTEPQYWLLAHRPQQEMAGASGTTRTLATTSIRTLKLPRCWTGSCPSSATR